MTTIPTNAPKLIKASIYRANGTLARYTGSMKDSLPVFSAHGTEIVTGEYERVTSEQVREYLGK